MATVLIVDDHLDTCRPLARLLGHLGHTGVCLGSGEEALTYLRGALPDVVLLDVMMPGIDGMEVLRQIRADPRMSALPVVMFSAVSDPQFRAHALAKGANDYWLKAGLDFDDIKKRIDAYVADAARFPEPPPAAGAGAGNSG